MRAVVARDGRLELVDAPVPEPGPGELLVAVRAAGLNRADLLMVRGGYVVGRSLRPPATGTTGTTGTSGTTGTTGTSGTTGTTGTTGTEGTTGTSDEAPPPRPSVPMGGEVAGEVVAVGPGVDGVAVGQRVMAMTRGGYAEQAIVDAARAMPVPDALPWPEAGAFPVTFVTAHDALVSAGRLDAGATVLVNAASSGVGVAALQLARLFEAGTVVACSTSATKLERLGESGVPFDVGVVADDPGVVDAVLAATHGHGIDVVVDNVGGPAWATNLAAAALGGRIVSVGRLGGLQADVDLDEVARKRVSLVGVTFRTRSAEEARAVVASAARDLVPALEAGRLRVLVDRTFPLEEAAEAHAYLRRNEHLGKVVLVP
jgi:NADPH2:quinone reductase